MLEGRPSSAVSTAFDGSLPPRSARFGVQTPRRDTARCLDLRATAPVTERSRPRQRALQGTCRQPEPTVRGRARAPLERLGFSFELPTRARSPRHQLAVASRPPGRWRSAYARMPFFGARAADVVALGVNAATSVSSGPGTSTAATWMRFLLVGELRRIATVPLGWVVTHLAGCLPRRRACTGASTRDLAVSWVRPFTGAALNKCVVARPVVPRRVNDLLLGILPVGWIACSVTAFAACQMVRRPSGRPRGLRSTRV